MTDNNIHEGIIEMVVTCEDPNDNNYNMGDYIDKETLDLHDLKPGDRVQYEIINDDVVILGKIYTKKVIEKIKKMI